MTGAATRQPVDYQLLADLLKALAYSSRLELLDQLKDPRAVRDIHIQPQRSEEGEQPDRSAARQTVQWHLERLVEADLVRVETVERGGRDSPVYVANPVKLYAVMEELRAVIARHAGRGLEAEHTATADHAGQPPAEPGPRLVLVHGVYEGRSYPLAAGTAAGGVWTLGRAKKVPVSLDYDPFVSHETAIVSRDAGGFSITDLGSKNGTRLNWARIPSGERRRLNTGDVIGVGRSLLVFLER